MISLFADHFFYKNHVFLDSGFENENRSNLIFTPYVPGQRYSGTFGLFDRFTRLRFTVHDRHQARQVAVHCPDIGIDHVRDQSRSQFVILNVDAGLIAYLAVTEVKLKVANL